MGFILSGCRLVMIRRPNYDELRQGRERITWNWLSSGETYFLYRSTSKSSSDSSSLGNLFSESRWLSGRMCNFLAEGGKLGNIRVCGSLRLAFFGLRTLLNFRIKRRELFNIISSIFIQDQHWWTVRRILARRRFRVWQSPPQLSNLALLSATQC